MTGRCPYPGQCISFKTGCKDDCPTANEYPSLEPSKIYEQWKLRRKIFTPGNLITVLANSEWTRLLFQLGLPSIHDLRTLYLGADEAVFRPGDKRTAKRRLGVPLDKPLVLCAAVNFTDPRKGSDFIQEIISQLGDKCTFAAFGHSASIIPGLVGLGYFINPKDIAHIFQAADVFIGTATEEAFGQTILEAQLTGCPVVAFRVGGVGEIVHHGVTGYLVEKGDTDAFTDSIKKIISNTNLCLSMCEASRKYAMRNYSISAHAARWELLIDDLESNKFNCVHSWTKSLLGLFRRYANRNRSFF
jgi:glycosyltransferase involved in cell wall biosynthesis